MYNILIVDDEPLIKANLKMYINNLKQSYNVIGDASNGQEAIDILERKQVHIILSDIMMPILNGVELSRYVHKNCPEVALVMLSNYDDFSYVKSTLKNGARDYLLKHTLNEKVLDECLGLIVEKLKDSDNAPNSSTVNLEHMQHQFILRLIEGQHPHREDIIEELTMLEIPIDFTNLIVCAIDIDNYVKFKESESLARIEAIQTSIITLVNQLPVEDFKIFISHIQEGRYLLLISFYKTNSAAKINRQLLNFIQNIKITLTRFLNLSATISYSWICRDISDIPEAYKKVSAGVKRRFLSGHNKIYDYVAKISGDEEMIWIDSTTKYHLVTELNYGNQDKLEALLKQIFDDLKAKQVQYSQCHLLLYDLINLVNQSCNNNSINSSELFESYNISSINLSHFDTIDDIEDFITHLFLKLFKRINSGINKEYSDLIKNTITFIMNNYHDPFTLTEVAEHVGVNKSYLSNLFKSEVGIGFNKYLTNIRIDQAKSKILKCQSENEDYDLEKIAEQCGFNSYSYFSTTFKKIEGISPVNYIKNQHRTH